MPKQATTRGPGAATAAAQLAPAQLDLMLHDRSTGELIPATVVPKRRPKTNELGEWFRMSQRAALRIAADKNLHARDLRVMLAVLGLAQYENAVTASLATIGKAAGDLDRAHVSRSIKRLVDRGVLYVRRDPDAPRGAARTYLLDPFAFGRGSSHSIQKLQREKLREHADAVRAAGAAACAAPLDPPPLRVVKGGAA